MTRRPHSWTTGRAAVLAAALAVGVAACGTGGGDEATDAGPTSFTAAPAPSGTGAPGASSPAAPVPGTTSEPAPGDAPDDARTGPDRGSPTGLLAFEAQTVGGEAIDVGEYAGRDVAIWFWAPW